MEAANLGAYLSPYPKSDIERALDILIATPDTGFDAHMRGAMDVLRAFPSGADSLALPTWVFANEPISMFAAHITKYCANSVREDGLLVLAGNGVVFCQGSAGTLQEVFQDAAMNTERTYGWRSPMVFLGRHFWIEDSGAYPGLRRHAVDWGYAGLVTLTDDPGEVVRFVQEHP